MQSPQNSERKSFRSLLVAMKTFILKKNLAVCLGGNVWASILPEMTFTAKIWKEDEKKLQDEK